MKRIVLIILIMFIITPETFADCTKWWTNYNDNALIENLQILYKQNPDLKIATIKTKQMQEAVKMSIANELPEITFNPSIGRELRSSDIRFGNLTIPNYSQTRYLLPLTMAYEVDLYGKNHITTKSTKKLSEITIQDEKAAKILISSTFASGYFNITKTNFLIRNQNKLVNIQEQITSMQKMKYEKGLCNKIEYLKEEQILTNLKEELNNLQTERELLKNLLISMLGDKNQTDLKLTELESINIPNTPDFLDSSTITKRPDFIKSELYVKKTGLDVKIARRELLPSFTLYGDIGFNAYHLNRIFSHNTLLSSIGVLPSIDIFRGGRKIANLKYKKLEHKKAIELYNKTVLISLQEVNDALYRIKNAKENYNENISRKNLEIEKYSLIEEKLNIGAISNLDKLKEERNLYIQQNEVIAQKAHCLVMTIELYKALGGQDFTETSSL